MTEENVPADSQKVGRTIAIKKSYIIISILAIVVVAVSLFLLFGRSGNNTSEYIAAYSPILGGNASINVVEFSDYECPFCQAAEGFNEEVILQLRNIDSTWQPPVPGIISTYVDSGRVNLVFRHYPVHGDLNPAMASYCAKDQGMFWEYHTMVFENYDALSLADLMGYATDLGLNTTQFNQCLTSQKYLSTVQKDISDGQALGVSGTPTFFIGNDEIGYEKVVGAQPFSAFQQIIESKL